MSLNLFTFGGHDHARMDFPRAARLHATLTFDFDKTDSACADWFEARIVTERRDIDTRAIRHFNNGLASVSDALVAIDLDRKFFFVRCVHLITRLVVTASSRRNLRCRTPKHRCFISRCHTL